MIKVLLFIKRRLENRRPIQPPHNYTRRARMEIVYILALLLKKMSFI